MSVVINDSCLESLSDIAAQHEDWIVQQAIVLLERRVFKAGPRLERPAAVRDYLRLKLVAEPNEIFVVVFMNSMHDVLAVEPMFHGPINATSVYPRVVLQRALQLNAAAVIFAHQRADRAVEDRLGAYRRARTRPFRDWSGHAVLVRRVGSFVGKHVVH